MEAENREIKDLCCSKSTEFTDQLDVGLEKTARGSMN